MPCVYFIRKGSEHVYKVGMSSGDPLSRMASLQTGNEEPLALCATIQTKSTHTAAEVEKYLHKTFTKYRLQGEWFALGLSDIEAALRYYSEQNYQVEIREALQKRDARFIVGSDGSADDKNIAALQKALARVKELEKQNVYLKDFYFFEAYRQAQDQIHKEMTDLRKEWYEQKQEVEELRARLRYHQITKQPNRPSWWQRLAQLFQQKART